MPEILKFETVLDNEILKEKLTQDLPHRIVKPILFSKNFQVRKSNFTTQNIQVKVNQKKGTITISTAMDMLIVYILFCWPLALYMYLNKQKHEALKKEVIDKLTEYHTHS